MDDDLRVADAPTAGARPGAPADEAPEAADTEVIPEIEVVDDVEVIDDEPIDDEPTDPGAEEPAVPPRRRWLRRVGFAAVVLLVLALAGLQVQAARMRTQVDAAEAAQRGANLEAYAARIRLETVGDRVVVAQDEEAQAQAELDRARTDMEAQGLEESALSSVQASTAKEVTSLRAGVKKVGRDIAEQARIQPAASACLFDMLRALGRVDTGARSGQSSEACRSVASAQGPA